jgi:hypothetical protein
MAIQVTGFFQNPSSGLIYDSPLLTLIPYLNYPGTINMDVNINNNQGTIPYYNVRQELIFNDLISDPYDKLLDGLEVFAINNLTGNTINQQSTFSRTHNYLPISGDTDNNLFNIDLDESINDLDI